MGLIRSAPRMMLEDAFWLAAGKRALAINQSSEAGKKVNFSNVRSRPMPRVESVISISLTWEERRARPTWQ